MQTRYIEVKAAHFKPAAQQPDQLQLQTGHGAADAAYPWMQSTSICKNTVRFTTSQYKSYTSPGGVIKRHANYLLACIGRPIC